MASNAELIARAKELVDEADAAFTRYNNQPTWDGVLAEDLSELVDMAWLALPVMKAADTLDKPELLQSTFTRIEKYCTRVITCVKKQGW